MTALQGEDGRGAEHRQLCGTRVSKWLPRFMLPQEAHRAVTRAGATRGCTVVTGRWKAHSAFSSFYIHELEPDITTKKIHTTRRL